MPKASQPCRRLRATAVSALAVGGTLTLPNLVTLQSLHRYPVKSCLGEELSEREAPQLGALAARIQDGTLQMATEELEDILEVPLGARSLLRCRGFRRDAALQAPARRQGMLRPISLEPKCQAKTKGISLQRGYHVPWADHHVCSAVCRAVDEVPRDGTGQTLLPCSLSPLLL
eukprot:g16572.t1